jgi:hypothetical protein
MQTEKPKLSPASVPKIILPKIDHAFVLISYSQIITTPVLIEFAILLIEPIATRLPSSFILIEQPEFSPLVVPSISCPNCLIFIISIFEFNKSLSIIFNNLSLVILVFRCVSINLTMLFKLLFLK